MILSNYNKINITFCGMMGSGKSIIGREFAKLIDFNFLDTDALIEKNTGKTINKIFEDSGEKYFRELEVKFISEILFKKNYVISLGGGVMNNKKLRKIIKNNSLNIYLYVEHKELAKRLEYSKKRPLIKNTNIKSRIEELLKKREKFYEQADLKIANCNTINDTISELKKLLKIYD